MSKKSKTPFWLRLIVATIGGLILLVITHATWPTVQPYLEGK